MESSSIGFAGETKPVWVGSQCEDDISTSEGLADAVQYVGDDLGVARTRGNTFRRTEDVLKLW